MIEGANSPRKETFLTLKILYRAYEYFGDLIPDSL